MPKARSAVKSKSSRVGRASGVRKRSSGQAGRGTAKKTTAAKKARKATSSSRAAKKTSKKVTKKTARKAAKPARRTTASSRAGAKKTRPVAKAPRSSSAKSARSSKPAPAPSSPSPVSQMPPTNGSDYSVGTFIVHPKYGVGRVEGVQEQPLGGGEETGPCLEIFFAHHEMKLSIPVEQVDRSGMRRPIARRELDQVFKVLRGRATLNAERRSSKRVLDYRKRLSQGDPTSLAEAVRDLGRLSRRKPLSYEERRILGTALRILSREVALARGREPDQVREEIESIVYR